MPTKKKRFSERREAGFRILVLIVSGIILSLWGHLVCFIALISWFVAVFSEKRNKILANFCEPWNTESYKFMNYMTFMSNKRPFPFSDIEKISKYK
ncbi:MAG: DUF4389 domain-containing protein [archaeon]